MFIEIKTVFYRFKFVKKFSRLLERNWLKTVYVISSGLYKCYYKI